MEGGREAGAGGRWSLGVCGSRLGGGTSSRKVCFSKGPSNLSVNLSFPGTKESFFYEREARSAKCRHLNYRIGKAESRVKLYAFDSAHGRWVVRVQEGLF